MNLNFLRVFSRTQLVIGVVSVLVAVVFISVVFSSIIFKDGGAPKLTPSPSSFPSLPSSKGAPVVIEGIDTRTQINFRNYLDTEIGKTTEQEISKLPNILKKEALSGDKVSYEFRSADPLRNNQIIIKGGVAAFKTNVSLTEMDYLTPKFSFYKGIYGEPEKEFTGSARYGKYIKTYVYGEKGFALIVNPYTDEVFEIQSFMPTSVENYLAEWGKDVNDFVQPVQKLEY